MPEIQNRKSIFAVSAAPAMPDWPRILTGFAGGLVSITLVAFCTGYFNIPLLMAPFGATCVLLYAVPESPLAQPRSVIGGHVISTCVGLLAFHLLGNGPWEMGIAVGIAIAMMQVTRTVHAPAGADPLVVFLAGGPGWSFLFAPVFLGSVFLVVVALVVNNIGSSRKWPKYWW